MSGSNAAIERSVKAAEQARAKLDVGPLTYAPAAQVHALVAIAEALVALAIQRNEDRRGI